MIAKSAMDERWADMLNMDEKGDNALGMDDTTDIDNVGEEENEGRDTSGQRENAADAPFSYPVENARNNYAGNPQELKHAAVMVDKPVQRASIKEKLGVFKEKAVGTGKMDIGKMKGKKEAL